MYRVYNEGRSVEAVAPGYQAGAGEVLFATEPSDADLLGAFPSYLDGLKATAKALVDAEAERSRQQWITPGAGQALVYEAKRGEAEAWAAALPTPALADYSFMRARAARLNGVADVDVTQGQMQAVAKEWTARAAAWIAAGIAIEEKRESAKEAIDVAADQAAIDAVLAGLAWPAPV